ncbi:DUF4019 domain-containing protein [Pseudoduganella sp. FT26W]|uniref:DUF4019 domain-containing protein n=1 Tax=Duganella aquatilis TaxID=2666082 RepID=A0A844CU84_9BURK|nr:DUF4019 domain-containing protein [Duganella aquatilis]MRW83458.1 DUF4019 domain-containing protein [Duganella aquatilis]
MKLLSSIALAASLLVCSSSFAQGAKDVADARAASESWMKLMDAEDYSAAWNKGAEGVRKDMSKLAWNMLASAIHIPLGTFKSRSYQSASIKPASITFEYISDYQRSHAVRETVTTVKETDGVWRVSGYGIHSDDKE